MNVFTHMGMNEFVGTIDNNFKKNGFDFNFHKNNMSGDYEITYGEELIATIHISRLFLFYKVETTSTPRNPMAFFDKGKLSSVIDSYSFILILENSFKDDGVNDIKIKERLSTLKDRFKSHVKDSYEYKRNYGSRYDGGYSNVNVFIEKDKHNDYYLKYSFSDIPPFFAEFRKTLKIQKLNIGAMNKIKRIKSGEIVFLKVSDFDFDISTWSENDKLKEINLALMHISKIISFSSKFKIVSNQTTKEESVEKVEETDFIIKSLDEVISESEFVDNELIQKAIEMKNDYIQKKENERINALKQKANEKAISKLKAVEMYTKGAIKFEERAD